MLDDPLLSKIRGMLSLWITLLNLGFQFCFRNSSRIANVGHVGSVRGTNGFACVGNDNSMHAGTSLTDLV